ncbi:O-acetylhomoserine (thiol)-lyase [Dysgonomonas sp. PH5-45]|uniref:PLP-dependent transferase n=1 Tax=unclassified Dysgonomonas TaxID=2630389 RepID=UPI002474D465|nr:MULTISPECIES: PLP-dependent transferase [unclassified Dysgonomonas]MDH6354256.1 O-acetylhomoserine (thiol)-lyase [Dysgonomonas sp. PH5-45]MDH6387157.1 O-acetylhomoserine (thiol)-lyase [Dysgonomonas sp. PH5-37]
MEKSNCGNQKFSTRVIASKFSKPDAHGAISMPVYRNAAFEFESAEAIANAFQNKLNAHTYTRISNPTVENLELKIKTASGAQGVLCVSSGMAAISNTFLTITYAGCNIVASPHLFGNTFSLLQTTLTEFGVEVRFVDTDNLDEIAAAVDDNTVAFFCELITNPHMEIADLPEISKILKARNVPMIVDTTIIPWCGFKAKDFGVDLEIVSTTKYVSGGATSLGGAILDYGTFNWAHNRKLAKIESCTGTARFTFKLRREIARNMGACMDAESASLQALGMESLQLRYEHMSQSAYELALFLSEQSSVTKVNYPKLPTSAYKHISEKLFTGNPGAMLTFSLKDKDACFRFMNRLQVIRRATNLFDIKTLIIHPESTIYGTFSQEMKDVMGIEDNLLRLSVGLEDVADLKNDIISALDTL